MPECDHERLGTTLIPRKSVYFEPASSADAEQLVALRIAAMQPSLERLGRFDPQRARDRFLANFDPARTQHLVVDGQRVGFLVVRPQAGHLLLEAYMKKAMAP
jgi:hypothetical protein